MNHLLDVALATAFIHPLLCENIYSSIKFRYMDICREKNIRVVPLSGVWKGLNDKAAIESMGGEVVCNAEPVIQTFQVCVF